MSESQGFSAQAPTVRPTRWRGILLPVCLILVGGGVWAGIEIWNAERAFNRGRLLLRQDRDVEAERELERYLRWHPHNPKAILLWAEAVIKGDSRTPRDAAELAISGLKKIPDTSPLGAEARMREGRLAFLILQQPGRAEALLLRSAELRHDLLDTHYLLWKLLDMTERFHYSEAHFWNIYELTPQGNKAERLREWYLSQFSPGSANADLDRHMGFLASGESASEATENLRLSQFLANEPESSMVVAAYARWLLHARERDQAADLLKNFPAFDTALGDPYFVSVLVDLMIDLGRLDDARLYFDRWPLPRDGFLYWQTAGRVFEIVERNDKSAVDAYDRALAIWPGPAEWSVMHRRAQCLSRLGDRLNAELGRQESKRIELLMDTDVHKKLRLALVDLKSVDTMKQMVSFYTALHRSQEAKCWQSELDRLISLPARGRL